MEVKLTDGELEAIIQIKNMLKRANTPVPQFLHWIADRLTCVHKDDKNVDFVQTLRDRAEQLHRISTNLGIDRGPERIA